VSRCNEQVLGDLLPHLGQRGVAGQHMVDRRHVGFQIETDVQRGVGLRIEIDQKDPLSLGGQRSAQVDRRGGLSNAAFLVNDGYRTHWLRASFRES